MPTSQYPLPSGFSRSTTSEEALGNADLTGKLAVVTGGYAGLGLETVRVLSGAGASIIVPARDTEKAKAALKDLPRIEIHSFDLSNPASINAFGREFAASHRPLDLFIGNAGIMATPLAHDDRGFERQFATNHLGHFQLAAWLWPALKRSGNARVVALSSGAHRFSAIDFDDPNYQRRPYDAWKSYGQSKTANALFALELDRRGAEHGVRAFSVHPGSIRTELTRYVSDEDMEAIGFRDADGNIPSHIAALFKTIEQGAATTVWCATSRQLDGMGGVYCEDCDIAEALPADTTELRGVMSWAMDEEAAARLWTLSEKLLGISFE